MLVATKTDENYYDRMVPREEAEIFAVENDYQYFEMSSKTGKNAKGVLETVAETFVERL